MAILRQLNAFPFQSDATFISTKTIFNLFHRSRARGCSTLHLPPRNLYFGEIIGVGPKRGWTSALPRGLGTERARISALRNVLLACLCTSSRTRNREGKDFGHFRVPKCVLRTMAKISTSQFLGACNLGLVTRFFKF